MIQPKPRRLMPIDAIADAPYGPPPLSAIAKDEQGFSKPVRAQLEVSAG
jgi:hypothetical protein